MASQSADGHVYALINPCSLICNMQLNVLNDLAEAMKALDGKKTIPQGTCPALGIPTERNRSILRAGPVDGRFNSEASPVGNAICSFNTCLAQCYCGRVLARLQGSRTLLEYSALCSLPVLKPLSQNSNGFSGGKDVLSVNCEYRFASTSASIVDNAACDDVGYSQGYPG